MPVSFPREFIHDLPIVGLTFTPSPITEVTPLRSGKIISKDLGPTLWRARWEASIINEQVFGQVRAWYSTLLSLKEFYGYDRYREYPRWYKDGWGDLQVNGQDFDGTGNLDDVRGGGVLVDISNLPPDFKVRPGDFLAFDYGTSRALHMVVAPAASSISPPGNLTCEVRPNVRSGWTASPTTTVYFYRPAGKFIILPETWSEAVDLNRRGRVSFEAIQTL